MPSWSSPRSISRSEASMWGRGSDTTALNRLGWFRARSAELALMRPTDTNPDAGVVLRRVLPCACSPGRPATSYSITTRGATVRPNKIKQMWRDRKWVTLGWLSVSHGFTAEVMARQGFDALVVDMQHGLTDMNDVWPMLQAISQTETVPVVRVPWNDPPTIMKVLDLGAYAVIVPLVNTAQDAAKAVAACRYPPVGMRPSGPVRAVPSV